jgi:hypothetical protein
MVPDLTLMFVVFSLIVFKENVHRVLTGIYFDWSSFEYVKPFGENFRKKVALYAVVGAREKFSFSSTPIS